MSRDALAAYCRALSAPAGRVGEAAADFGGAGELEIQARWYSGELGREWTTVDGAAVRIEDFGRWNHESGPDFIDARVCIDGRERRGAIEIDPDVRDWDRHGHATNPAFRETVAHVFVTGPAARFFTRTCDHREVPQIRLTAGASRPLPPPVDDPISLDPARSRAILEAAARHRLALKAAALGHAAAVHGEDLAWFSALAVALGYKRNQTPFLLLAQRVGVRVAGAAGGEARLFGVAGFLEAPQPPAADGEVRAYLRAMWETWWSERARCERWILPGAAWQFHGSRPANHPHRRVAALAAIALEWPAVRDPLAESRRSAFAATLTELAHPFWTTRFTLQSARLGRPQTLIGAERVRDILLNVFHPLAVSRADAAWGDFLAERGPAPAAIMRVTARRFFGGSVDGALGSAAIQQGLLQVERDYRAAPDPRAYLAALRGGDFPPASECSTRPRRRG